MSDPEAIELKDKELSFTDSLVNCLSGLGTKRDKRTGGKFVRTEFGNNARELENMYAEETLAGKVVDIPPADMTREWRFFTSPDMTPEMIEEFEEAEKNLDLQGAIKTALSWSRLYGGAIIVPIFEGTGDVSIELREEDITEGSLKRLIVLDSFNAFAAEGVELDPFSEAYMKPKKYQITGGKALLHFSRVIRFDGRQLPRNLYIENRYWGQSLLEYLHEDIRNAVEILNNIAGLMNELNIDIISIKGLNTAMNAGQEDNIKKRFEMYAFLKSLYNVTLIDSEEQFNNRHLQLGGIASIAENALTMVAAGADIPVTRLMGVSPAGLNSTGEGDQKNYYDGIAAAQEEKIRPALHAIDRMIARSLWGDNAPENLDFEFNPLFQESGTERATRQLNNAQRDAIYLGQGVIDEAIVAKQLQEDGVYTNITDEYITTLEDAIEELEEEDPENDIGNEGSIIEDPLSPNPGEMDENEDDLAPAESDSDQ